MKYRLLLSAIVSGVISLGLVSFHSVVGPGSVYCDKYCKQKIEFHVDPLGTIKNPCENGEIPYIKIYLKQNDTCIHPPPELKYSPNN
jgi:hypothetical protein